MGRIIAAHDGGWPITVHCPKCGREITGKLCGKCNVMVHKRHGFNVATKNGERVSLNEIRAFLHPPPKTTVSIPKEAVEYAKAQRKEPTRKPMVSRYEPRPLTHEKPKRRWAWRSVYAIITLWAAALTVWRFLEICF